MLILSYGTQNNMFQVKGIRRRQTTVILSSRAAKCVIKFTIISMLDFLNIKKACSYQYIISNNEVRGLFPSCWKHWRFFFKHNGIYILAKNVTYLFQQADYETHIGVVLVAVISMKIRDSINSLNGVWTCSTQWSCHSLL